MHFAFFFFCCWALCSVLGSDNELTDVLGSSSPAGLWGQDTALGSLCAPALGTEPHLPSTPHLGHLCSHTLGPGSFSWSSQLTSLPWDGLLGVLLGQGAPSPQSSLGNESQGAVGMDLHQEIPGFQLLLLQGGNTEQLPSPFFAV